MKFYISETRHSIEFLLGRNAYIEEGTNHADLHDDANYWFLVIDNRHSAVSTSSSIIMHRIKTIAIISKLYVQIT